MITLQDAIERAKLASDEDGMLSNYMYDQIVQQLGIDDKYAFTMALVDLGIHTKLGTHATYQAMSRILAQDYEEEKDEDEEEDELSIEDEFVKAAQAFRRQTPSGLWVPDSYYDEDEEPKKVEKPQEPSDYSSEPEENSYFDTEEDYEQFMESSPFYSDEPSEPGVEEPPALETKPEAPQIDPEPEFVEVSTEGLVESLERAGILINESGDISLYKQNLPGLYTDRVFKPQPLDKSINRLNNEADSIDREQDRISSLQDILTVVGKDFEALDQGGKLKDYVDKFGENGKKLEQFKYSEKSPSPEISSIAQGLSTLKEYLQPSTKSVKKAKNDILKLRKLLGGLETQLGQYYQTQYEKYDAKLEAIDALEKVRELKESSPEQYEQIVKEIGGITAARFVEAQMRNYWDREPDHDYGSDHEESPPTYASLELDIGKGYLVDFFEKKQPGQGEQLLEAYLGQGGFKHDSEESEDLRNDLEGEFEIGEIEGYEEEYTGVFFNIVEGFAFTGALGLWYYDRSDPSTGYPGGWIIDGSEKLTQGEVKSVQALVEEDLQTFMDLHMKGEFQ